MFDYCVAKVAEKKDMQDNTVKGSQFKQPYKTVSVIARAVVDFSLVESPGKNVGYTDVGGDCPIFYTHILMRLQRQSLRLSQVMIRR